LLRLKGIVNILESPDRPAVIHGVQHVFHPPSWLMRWPSDDHRSRMIFITRGIPRGWVEALLVALDAEVAAASAQRYAQLFPTTGDRRRVRIWRSLYFRKQCGFGDVRDAIGHSEHWMQNVHSTASRSTTSIPSAC